MAGTTIAAHVPVLLQETASAVCAVLDEVLRSASEQWWDEFVLPHLPKEQKQVGKAKVRALSGLDLAALLRVMDKNWRWVSSKLGLPWATRNFLKELQEIRNRWAHPPVRIFPPDDVYRDLDTLLRFLWSIAPDEEITQKVELARRAAARALATIAADQRETVGISALERLVEQCERDTEKVLGFAAAKRFAHWRNYRGDQQQLVRFIQRLIHGPKRLNGRILDGKGGLSLERIVIENPQFFTEDDVRMAKETLGRTLIVIDRSQAS